MNPARFDQISRQLAAAQDRRQVIKMVGAGLAGALAGVGLGQARRTAAQVSLDLPFPKGETWHFTGGPHANLDNPSVYCAIDFAPPAPAIQCPSTVVSQHWAVAAAAGTVDKIRTSDGTVEILHSDGHTGTGYGHLANIQVGVGQPVQPGTPLGHPACLGKATGVHLHFYFLVDKTPVPADGRVVGGWTVHAGSQEYAGSLTNGSRTLTQPVGGVFGSWAGNDIRSDTQLPPGCRNGEQYCAAKDKCVAACASGQVLDPQSCKCGCPDGSSLCGGTCVPCSGGQQPDPKNNCTCTCPKDNPTLCNGICVNTLHDASNCHGCGDKTTGQHICSPGTCANGQCACPTGTTQCQYACVKSCPAGQHLDTATCSCACDNSLTPCGDQCIDTSSDPLNCKTCGNSCGDPTKGAACCSGQCVTLGTDAHCSACNDACQNGQTCQQGTCVSSTTGTLVVHSADASSGSPVLEAWYELQGGGGAYVLDEMDGTSAWSSIAGDGAADGTVTFGNLQPGSANLIFGGVMDTSSAFHDGDLPISTQYVDSVEYRTVTISAGQTTEMSVSLTGPTASMSVNILDSCGNPVSDDVLASNHLFWEVVPNPGTWGRPNLAHTPGTYYFGTVMTTQGLVDAVMGAGPWTVTVLQGDPRTPDATLVTRQTFDVSLGQVTNATITVPILGTCQSSPQVQPAATPVG